MRSAAARTNVVSTRTHQEIRVSWTHQWRRVSVRIALCRTLCVVEIVANALPDWTPFVKLPPIVVDADDFERIVEAARKGLDVYSAHFD